MAMSCLDSDLSAVFASSDFGEAEGAVRGGVIGNPISGIFDDEDIESQNGEGATVIVHQASFTCASSKVPDPDEGEVFTIRGADYMLRFWNDDGSGVITLYFEKVE